MSTETTMTWSEANQAYLMRSIETVRVALARSADAGSPDSNHEEAVATEAAPWLGIGPPPALEQLCGAFGLSRFEREVLLLCAAMELDSSFAPLIAAAQNGGRPAFPTFSLALGALAEPHWSALSPAAPLRRWRLIEVNNGENLTTSRIRIDERVLHYLAGVAPLDERLSGLLEYIAAPDDLPNSHDEQAEQIARLWVTAGRAIWPVVLLCGDEQQSKRAVAAAACARIGVSLYAIRADAVPHQPAELDAFTRLWQREAVLSNAALLIEGDDFGTADGARDGAVTRLLEEIRGAVIFSSRARRRSLVRPAVTFDVGKPTVAEQRALWQGLLGDHAARLNGNLAVIGAQFNFEANVIRSACVEARQSSDHESDFGKALWDICRAHGRPRLNDLAQRLVAAVDWRHLVLPEAQQQSLREIAVHVRQRTQVYETWGFAADGTRGLGISALFAGPSGTGKTMAAEVLANELNLDLYRIDLSQVVSKYIGETEKNLRRVFDAAEDGGAILLFDEADALFGKRSEVKDSHDRYANIEISYLLQRMEAYRGLAILTTNMKSALDTAFLRRLRFVVQFPFPDAPQRAEIWRRVFPAQTPTAALDYERLARLQVTGGNIRNMALNAAFQAAESGEHVRMTHLLHAARSEYAKLERPLTEAEIGGWR